MILPLLAMLAAATSSPSSAAPCPELLTVETLVCRAVEAGARGAFRDSAEGFERAAETKRVTGAVAFDPEPERQRVVPIAEAAHAVRLRFQPARAESPLR